MREKELVYEVEGLAEKNAALAQDVQASQTVREQKAQLARELQLSKEANTCLHNELSKAKEALLKTETFREVARTKESQLLKDHEGYERQVAQQAKELQKIRDELA